MSLSKTFKFSILLAHVLVLSFSVYYGVDERSDAYTCIPEYSNSYCTK